MHDKLREVWILNFLHGTARKRVPYLISFLNKEHDPRKKEEIEAP
jgi:hypothetical protein